MYDTPLTITYAFGEFDFGGGANESLSIKGPPGATGVLRDISHSASEVHAGSTSTSKVQVGTAADPDAYAELDLATTADTDSISAADGDYTLRTLPKDTQVEVTFVAAVGTPTGKGYTFITIDWNAKEPHVPA